MTEQYDKPQVKEAAQEIGKDVKKLLRESGKIFTNLYKRGVCSFRMAVDKWRSFAHDISAAVDKLVQPPITDGTEKSPYWQAHDIIGEMEKDRTAYGPQERDMIVNYAYQTGDMDRVQNLAAELAAEGFELQHSYANPEVQKRIEHEIETVRESRQEFDPGPNPAIEPVVTIVESRDGNFCAGDKMTLFEANERVRHFDTLYQQESPGFKGNSVVFQIDYMDSRKPDRYFSQQNIGNGEGSIIDHIQNHICELKSDTSRIEAQFESVPAECREAVKEKLMPEILKSMEEVEQFQLPLLKSHCLLTNLEKTVQARIATMDPSIPGFSSYSAHCNAIQDYVVRGRRELNAGRGLDRLPEPPILADFFREKSRGVKIQVAKVGREADKPNSVRSELKRAKDRIDPPKSGLAPGRKLKEAGRF